MKNKRADEDESYDILINNKVEEFNRLHSMTVHRIRRRISPYRDLKEEARNKFFDMIELAEESL